MRRCQLSSPMAALRPAAGPSITKLRMAYRPRAAVAAAAHWGGSGPDGLKTPRPVAGQIASNLRCSPRPCQQQPATQPLPAQLTVEQVDHQQGRVGAQHGYANRQQGGLGSKCARHRACAAGMLALAATARHGRGSVAGAGGSAACCTAGMAPGLVAGRAWRAEYEATNVPTRNSMGTLLVRRRLLNSVCLLDAAGPGAKKQGQPTQPCSEAPLACRHRRDGRQQHGAKLQQVPWPCQRSTPARPCQRLCGSSKRMKVGTVQGSWADRG